MGRERLPKVKITWQGDDVSGSVLSVEVEDDDRLADKAELLYEGRTAAAAFAEGQELAIELGWEEESTVLFQGLIVKVASQAAVDGRERTTVTALDLSTRMHREAKTFHFSQGKVSEVVQTIATAYGLELGTVTCEPDTELTPQAPLSQVGQTDLAFVQSLARRYGARAFVEVNDGVPKFYFVPERVLLAAPVAGSMNYCGGTGELISFDYRRAASEAAAATTATAVDPATAAPGTVTPEPPATAAPISVDDALLSELAKRDASEKAAYEIAVELAAKAPETPDAHVRMATAVGTPSDPARARLATHRDLTRALGMTGAGVAVGTVHLRAKSQVELYGIAPWAEGAWYVRRAKHVYRDTSTAEGRSGTYLTSFLATR